MKTLLAIALLAFSTAAVADESKAQPTPSKLGRDARVFVLDKEAPSLDKTVPLSRPHVIGKNK